MPESKRYGFGKTVIYSLLPLFLLVIFSELMMYSLDLGTRFSKASKFWSGAMSLMESDPHAGIKMKPNFIGGEVSLNSLGFRDNELRSDSHLKIACFGDSTTFGWGVKQGESYPAVLEAKLEETQQYMGQDVEVLNAGAPSYTIFQGLQVYLHYVMDLADWDYVVLTFGWNETPGAELDLEYAMRNPPGRGVVHAARTFFQLFRTYNFLEDLYFKAIYDGSQDPLKLAHEQYARLYENFIRFAQGQGSEVIILPVLIKPGSAGIPMADRMIAFNQTVEELAKKHGAKYLPVDKAFLDKEEQVGWIDFFHYDQVGHEVVAESLLAEISSH
jgi:lysophospholipase L1-like esterase